MPLTRPLIGLTSLALTLALSACVSADADPRSAWLQQQLVNDNRDLLERSPELVGAKFSLMATDPYVYFRGTANIYWRDATTPGAPAYAATDYGSLESARVTVLGDPHFENIGTYHAPGEPTTVAFNDFDGATYGPYWIDLRRLALSFAVITDATTPELLPLSEAVTDAIVEGYVETINAPPDALNPQLGGPIAWDVLRRANRDGLNAPHLTRYTDPVTGLLNVVPWPEDPSTPIDDVVVDLDAEAWQLIALLVSDYASRDPRPSDELAIVDAGRQLGSGVSSYPVLRYYVVVEGPTPAVEDNILLEFKEIGDPVFIEGLHGWADPEWTSNGERVAVLQARLHGRPDLDPWLGWADAGALGFRVRERSSYQKGVRVARLVEKLGDDFQPDDLVTFARWSGALLAYTHAHGTTIDGAPAGPPIADAIGGDTGGLAAETRAVTTAYLEVLLDDRARLAELLDVEGLTLGYAPARTQYPATP